MPGSWDVELVQWPAERHRRAELERAHQPRVLLVDGASPPPLCPDPLEDWVRVPCDDLELRVRTESLRMRLERQVELRPELDDDGVLRFGEAWVALPPVEARLTGALVDSFGAVVSRQALGKAGWPSGPPGRNALDVHVLRLRRRLEPVSLAIRTIRSRGYLLESAA